jgi:outer membrane protein OmpA-like peptidoglycan-associated protein
MLRHRPLLLLLIAAFPAAPQAARKAATLLEPVKPIEVTHPGGAILSFRHRSGATEVVLKGTKLAPEAQGKLKVESKGGYLELDADRNSLTGLPRPSSFGRDFLTYVFWAVTPDGQAQNLGEILFSESVPGQTTGLNVTTPNQTFWMMATAEPHFAVSQPSDLVVLVSQNQEGLATSNKALPVQGALLYYTHFTAYSRQPGAPAAGVTPELAQARKAVELAANSGILKTPTPAGQEPLPDERRTREILALAKEFLSRAEQLAGQSSSEARRESIQFARTAAQTAEDARSLATGAVGQVYIRQLLREIESAEAEIQRFTQLDAGQKAEIARLSQQLAELKKSGEEAIARLNQQLAGLRSENSELAKQLSAAQADLAGLRRDAKQLLDEFQRLRGERDRLAQDRDRICSELRKQLEALGSLRRDGGRIVLTLASDILFDFNKFDLRDTAREQLAKLAMLQILIFRDVPVKYVGHTDLVGAEDYNQWLSEQRALRVAEYLLTQRQQLYRDDPQAGRIAGDLSTIRELLAMDAARSKANAAGRQTLLEPVLHLVEGMGQRSPLENTPGKNERNRRVEVVFAETKGSSMTSLCESPAAP